MRQAIKFAAGLSAAAVALAACGSSSTGTGTGGGGAVRRPRAAPAARAASRSAWPTTWAGAVTSPSTTRRRPVSTRPSRSSASARRRRRRSTARPSRPARSACSSSSTPATPTSSPSGFAYAKSVGTAAKANPSVKFAIVDDASPDSAGANVDQITFAENQGSFLVGAAAALKSKANHIGFVGGVNTDLIKKFQAGYEAGAKAVNPNIVIDVKYLTQPPDFSGFSSVDKGKAAAEGMYQGGADIVYHAAGGSGGGVFTAAKAAGKLAIGVDSDQALTAPADVRDVILTSMIKKVDVGVYDFINSVKSGTFKAGNKVFDLKAGGVDYSTTGGKVDDIKTKLDDYKAQIIAGTITVPSK